MRDKRARQSQRSARLPSHLTTHIMQQLLQVFLQFTEVDAGNEAFTGFGQAVPGQLSYLVVNEAEDPIGHWQNVLWGVVLDEFCQPLLHLRCGLIEYKTAVNNLLLSCCQPGAEKITKSPVTDVTSTLYKGGDFIIFLLWIGKFRLLVTFFSALGLTRSCTRQRSLTAVCFYYEL